jgi:hypothetical protein
MGGEEFLAKKSISLIIAVAALSAIMVISAATVYTFNTTNQATVPISGTVTVTIGSTTYNDGQTLPIDWGVVSIGQNTKQITINSIVNTPVTPAITSSNLPSGWTLTLSNTNPISAGASVTMNIVLTVPSGALATSYNWNAQITASTA